MQLISKHAHGQKIGRVVQDFEITGIQIGIGRGSLKFLALRETEIKFSAEGDKTKRVAARGRGGRNEARKKSVCMARRAEKMQMSCPPRVRTLCSFEIRGRTHLLHLRHIVTYAHVREGVRHCGVSWPRRYLLRSSVLLAYAHKHRSILALDDEKQLHMVSTNEYPREGKVAEAQLGYK